MASVFSPTLLPLPRLLPLPHSLKQIPDTICCKGHLVPADFWHLGALPSLSRDKEPMGLTASCGTSFPYFRVSGSSFVLLVCILMAPPKRPPDLHIQTRWKRGWFLSQEGCVHCHACPLSPSPGRPDGRVETHAHYWSRFTLFLLCVRKCCSQFCVIFLQPRLPRCSVAECHILPLGLQTGTPVFCSGDWQSALHVCWTLVITAINSPTHGSENKPIKTKSSLLKQPQCLHCNSKHQEFSV